MKPAINAKITDSIHLISSFDPTRIDELVLYSLTLRQQAEVALGRKIDWSEEQCDEASPTKES